MAYGEGSIFEGKNKAGKKVWFVEVVISHKANGKPATTRRTAHTLQAARKIRVELNALKNQGKLTQQHNISVADFGRYWARNVKPNTVKPSTAYGYEWLSLVAPRLEDADSTKKMSNISQLDGFVSPVHPVKTEENTRTTEPNRRLVFFLILVCICLSFVHRES